MPEEKIFKYEDITFEKLDRFYDLMLSDYENYEWWGRDLLKSVLSNFSDDEQIFFVVALIVKLGRKKIYSEDYLEKGYYQHFFRCTLINFGTHKKIEIYIPKARNPVFYLFSLVENYMEEMYKDIEKTPLIEMLYEYIRKR